MAEILGLAHRNSVSTYRSRYPDFPQGESSPGRGRARVWRRGDVVDWHTHFRRRRSEADHGDDSPRLQELVAATARLLLANPGMDVSIRRIAAEAGVAHSDLYRYAASKSQLRHLALDAVSNDFAQTVPTTYRDLLAALPTLVVRAKEHRAVMAVLAHEMITQPGGAPTHELAVATIATVLAEHRAATGATSAVDPEVAAACIGAMVWGLWLFEDRWRGGLGLAEIPPDQVATVARAILEV